MKPGELKAVCRALNILFWKLPAVAGRGSGSWWAAELRDKGIAIEWDEVKEEFVPSPRSKRPKNG